MHVPADNLQLADRAAAAERLRDAVQRTGGPTQIAERAGVPLSTLNGYLAGGEMKLTNLVRLARTTGASVEWLATGGGMPPPWIRAKLLNSGASDVDQQMLRPPLVDAHWLAKAIEIVEALGGAGLPLRERAKRIAHSYELLVAPEDEIEPLPPVVPRGR